MVINARRIGAVAEPESESPVACPCVHDLIKARQDGGRSGFTQLRTEYEDVQGKIVEEYYAVNCQAALLLVAKARSGPDGGAGEVVHKLRLYYDHADSTPEFDDVFRSARRVERKYSVLLSGQSQEILVQGLYTAAVALLGVLDAMVDSEQKRERVAAAVLSARKEIRQIEQNARDAALDRALIRYLGGLAVGAVAATVAVAAVAFLPTKAEIVSQLIICVVSGAIGAIVSVMTRTANREKVRVSLDQGWLVIILSGCFRLIIGAVFGAAMLVLVRAGLLPLAVPASGDQVTLFFAGLAFLAGFSERRAQDTIVRTLPGAVDQTAAEPARGKES
ncbi:hypothetical protein QRX60_39265 [Amycolatopsis mongoliensis]|uniref:Uncharacterized protein n=1 Tax=Amycolatopsis mongoliensis TaxID=715475 RepID=A0A9Y2NCW7_9PSEU|nr:hypothetical protein [Amycolatopsis sp. 4-36]WIY00047.1 hypothetical protein QRX60_39265 [Amycolatopsis sp. 4-36]